MSDILKLTKAEFSQMGNNHIMDVKFGNDVKHVLEVPNLAKYTFYGKGTWLRA